MSNSLRLRRIPQDDERLPLLPGRGQRNRSFRLRRIPWECFSDERRPIRRGPVPVPPPVPPPSPALGIDALTTSAGFYTFPLKRLKPKRRKRDDEEVILAGRGSTPH